MLIRKATVRDCSELTKLRVEMRSERETQNLSELEQQAFCDETNRFFKENIGNGSFAAFVAVDEEKIVATSGVCFYFVLPTYENRSGMVAYVMNMYTIPQYRKRGIATLLLDHIVKEAQARNCSKITLAASEMGRPIYNKYGFREVRDDMVYFIERKD